MRQCTQQQVSPHFCQKRLHDVLSFESFFLPSAGGEKKERQWSQAVRREGGKGGAWNFNTEGVEEFQVRRWTSVAQLVVTWRVRTSFATLFIRRKSEFRCIVLEGRDKVGTRASALN